MTRKIIAGLLVFALVGVCAAAALAAFSGYRMLSGMGGARLRLPSLSSVSASTIEEEKVMLGDGPGVLRVENDLGYIKVEAGDGAEIKIRAEKVAWGASQAEAEAALKDIEVVVEQQENQVRVTTRQPAEVGVLYVGSGDSSVNFTITVPKQMDVTLQSSAGDLGLHGVSGKATVKTSFGNLDLSDITGDLDAKTTNGAIKAARIQSKGSILISSEFGSLELEDLSGDSVSLHSENGKITADGLNASQDIQVDTAFGNISLSNGKAASLTAVSQNGQVTVENMTLSGVATMETAMGGVALKKVAAQSYMLKTANGKIQLTGAQGQVQARSSFGSIVIEDAVDVTIDAETDNGEISFSGSLGEGPHRLESRFGNVSLVLPAKLGLNVKLSTQFGSVRSDLPIAMTIQGNANNQKTEGTINGGGAQLTVSTDNGNIEIKTSDQ